MKKYFKLQTLLVVLMILGSFPGIYAINITQHDKNIGVGIGKINDSTHGAKTIYVAKNGTDRNEGLTRDKPKRNIENAIDAANPGDIIRVAPGTYQYNLKINKNITLIGENQNNTIIDGQGLANCICISPVKVTIANFTIKNGKQNRNKGIPRVFGGGIYNEGTVSLINSTITNNDAEYGGGIYNLGIMTIKGVTITNNCADLDAGGIENQLGGTMTIEDSTITNNTVTEYGGGGIFNKGTMTIKRVTIKNNRAQQGCGGGVENGKLLTIEDSKISENTADHGGGISNGGLLYLYGSTITHNSARDGGGINNGNSVSIRAYIDDITVITDNTPNNFKGKPFIPA